MYQKKFAKKTMKKVLAGIMALALTLSAVPAGVQAADVNKEGKAAAKADLVLDEGKEYHAYALFTASNSWVFRGRFFEKNNGLHFKYWDKMVTSLDRTEAEPVDGKITDTVIKGNGHYTVKIEDLNGSPSQGVNNAELGILGFTTDIPANDKIHFDNVTVKVDGIEKGTVTGDDVYYDKDDIEDPGLITVEVVNTWQEECKGLTLQLPQDSVEISFDVTGFNYDNPDAVSRESDDAKNASSDAAADTKTATKKSTFPIVPVVVVVVIVGVAAVVIVTKKKK